MYKICTTYCKYIINHYSYSHVLLFLDNCNPQAEDPSSSGKKRAQKQGRPAGVKRDFQEISKNLIESMERQAEARSSEQRRQVQDLLVVHERQAKAAQDQVTMLQGSISKLTDFLGAYMARQP